MSLEARFSGKQEKTMKYTHCCLLREISPISFLIHRLPLFSNRSTLIFTFKFGNSLLRKFSTMSLEMTDDKSGLRRSCR